ncbi:ALDH-like protein [Laetiporus sulphureus 93-53]|uniref:ALDH-like protein n=1 Tax=Laetiporus sulphureus 93-53 TaxID=1314785 RepID=A0A165DPJ7_9APHY|nr:ALDH-like protein [Laetiporus sulphureus 93-53]KZT05339.1 ALDH-like protein [Laetiporus sulphureus 93-53]
MPALFTPLYIDGQECSASSDACYEVQNSYSKEIVTLASSASSQDCQNAVDAAARAFNTWERVPLSAKRDYFLKAADLLETERYRAKVKLALQEETCAADFLVDFNLQVSVEWLRHIAGLVTQLKGESFPSTIPGGYVIAQRRAQGVILAVAPWNAPVILAVRAIGYPIICGNTVVFKTSENSPRTQFIIAELLHEVGLPKGVLNVVHISRENAPAMTSEMIAHPAVRKINFTGSDRVGRLIAAEAAKYLKPCVFELGGKAPVVVLEGADVPRAARAITFSALLHSGQICMSTERVIVQRQEAQNLIKALIEEFSKFKSGGPGERLSAQFTEASAAHIVAMLAEAKQNGARFLLGDGTRDGPVVQPHIVTDVKPGNALWDQESFGPVVVLVEVDTIDEAVDFANASDYTLVGALWTKDLNTAMDVSMRIRSGCVNVNGPTVHLEDRDHTGLGGGSGYSNFSVESFTDVRMVVIHPADAPPYPLVG